MLNHHHNLYLDASNKMSEQFDDYQACVYAQVLVNFVF